MTHFDLPLMKLNKKYSVRNLRQESFQDYDAIIFVVDSADKESFHEAHQELWNFLSFAPDLMDHAVILILANKQGTIDLNFPSEFF